MNHEEKWTKIVQLHQYTKSLILLAEEYELNEWRKFLQPSMEELAAFDHLIRSKSAELKLVPDLADNETPRYIEKNLDKALGHTYRSFFDTADWLSVIFREKIMDLLSDFDNECLTSVMPEYYQKIRPGIDQINSDIANIREKKDISIDNSLIEPVEKYNEKINILIDYHKNIILKSPALIEFKQKQKKSDKSRLVLEFIIGAILVILSVFLGVFLNHN